MVLKARVLIVNTKISLRYGKTAQLELLGDTIRSLRDGLGLTQDQMAFNAGFSRSYYSGLNAGLEIFLLSI